MGEIWDAYDAGGDKSGFDLYRDEPAPENVYHIVVEIYVITKNNRVIDYTTEPR